MANFLQVNYQPSSGASQNWLIEPVTGAKVTPSAVGAGQVVYYAPNGSTIGLVLTWSEAEILFGDLPATNFLEFSEQPPTPAVTLLLQPSTGAKVLPGGDGKTVIYYAPNGASYRLIMPWDGPGGAVTLFTTFDTSLSNALTISTKPSAVKKT